MDVSFEETHRRYQAALESALEEFRNLLSSSNSRHWIPIPSSTLQSSTSRPTFVDGQPNQTHQILNGLGPLDFSNVQVHRRKFEGSPVIRAVCELATDPETVDVDEFRATLQTAEVRGMWDNLVDKATVVEMIDPQTRIVKTDFRLGWPAHPRDSITISKTFNDSSTIIDISTSLPRSDDEPAYLRPSPPFVRSHVHLLAWCIQFTPPSLPTRQPLPRLPSKAGKSDDENSDESTLKDSSQRPLKTEFARGKITVFWKINWKGAMFSTQHAQIASLLNGFVDYVRTQANRVPIVSSYGDAIDFSSASYDKAEEELNVQYSILPEEPPNKSELSEVDPDQKLKLPSDAKRLQRAIEFKLSADQGWDVRIKVNGPGIDLDESLETVAERPPGALRTILRITHLKPLDTTQLIRVKVTVQRLAGGKSLRVNQKPVQPKPSDLITINGPFQPLLDDAKSINSNLSLNTGTTEGSRLTSDSVSTFDMRLAGSPQPSNQLLLPPLKRSNPPSRASVITALLRRSYIYFSSLLQEPEAKWKHVADARGVTVTQLQSIDPTLTVYRAEATFVGVGVWNVYSALTTAGARVCWDKSLADAVLLEDLNDLSSLWQFKQKGAWPVAPRDSILITTTYKSPSSVHLFSVSTDDSNLFPSIQPPSAGYIRTRTEILGWSIESLSPTTTQITLIDQHDPMGWSPKSWTPSQLINQVSSVGDFTLKSGGPPILSRVSGARVTLSKYEHDKGTFRAEYSASEDVLLSALSDPAGPTETAELTSVECELRCDCETWASSLDIVVDPPPTNATCLKRHKLSSGGGWWIMVEHEISLLKSEKAKILIRRGAPGLGEKGSVFLNGSSMKVDSEELTEDEAKSLAKRRRVKANLIPLDQYPLCGPRMWRNNGYGSDPSSRATTPLPDRVPDEPVTTTRVPSNPKLPASLSLNDPSKVSSPMTVALEALARLQSFHIDQGPDIMIPPAGWTLLAEKGASSVYKRIVPLVSDIFPIHRVDKVIQGVTAEEMVATLSAVSLRPLWDDRLETAALLESYGYGCTTHLMTTKPTFPFKSRLLRTSNVHAQVQIPSASVTSSINTVYFVAASSFSGPNSTLFDDQKINPQGLVEANVLLEGWIMETIDPYSSSSHEIPSTRCTYFSAVDYGGSVPVALNSMLNTNLSRVISGLESVVKSHGPLPKLCRPVFGVRINGPLGIDGSADWQWKLTGTERSTVVLLADATAESIFQTVLLVCKGINELSLASSPASGSGSGGPLSAHSNPRSESIRQLGVSPPVSNDSGSTYVRRLASNPDLRRKTSAGQVRRTGVANSLNSFGSHPLESKSSDLIIGEIALDRKLYPHGCNVSCKANFAKDAIHIRLKPMVEFPTVGESAASALPIQVSVHEMPSPTVFAASLDPAARREHLLLRMTLPVGGIHSPIRDPLINTANTELPMPPLWYSTLSKKNALVHLRIEPIKINKETLDATKKSAGRSRTTDDTCGIIINGERQNVIPLRESQTALDRWEVDDYVGSPPCLSRGTHLAKVPKTQPLAPLHPHDALPKEFIKPTAIAADFVAEAEDTSASSPVPGSTMGTPQILSPVVENGEFEDENNQKNQINGDTGQTLDPSHQSRSGRFPPLNDFMDRCYFKKLLMIKPENLLQRRTYTTRHLVITALIFFLLGSLLRSLSLPNDFFIIPPGASESESRLLNLLGDRHHWKETKRLIEFRIFFIRSWSFILAAVRNPT